jgi:YjbR
MKINTVRTYAMSLEAVTEEPHHNYSSFRVRGKIFVTIPPDEEFIHVFVGEEDRQSALALYPDFIEKLLWGSKVLGLRVALASAKPEVVKMLVGKAYETRVQKDAGLKLSKSKSRVSRVEAVEDRDV